MKYKILSCGQFSKFQFFPLLLVLFNLINKAFTLFVMTDYEFSYHLFFLGYLLYASKLLGGVLHLVSNCLQEKQILFDDKDINHNISQLKSFIDQSDNEALDVFSFHDVKIEETKTKFFVFVLFIIVSFLDYIFYYIITAMIEYSEDSNYHIQLETFNIIIIMCFSRIILQYPIYRHCKVAFLFFVIGFSCYRILLSMELMCSIIFFFSLRLSQRVCN